MTLLETAPPRNKRALALSLFLIFNALTLCGLALLLMVFNFGLSDTATSEQLTFSLLVGGLFFSAILLLPGIYINTALFFRWPDLNLRFPHVHDGIVLMVLGAFWGLTLWLGQITASTALAVIALPLLNILAVVLPVLFFLKLALRKLMQPSAQQGWSIFGVALVIGPLLGTLLEVLAVGIGLLIVGIFAASDAALTRQITRFVEIIQQNGDSDALIKAIAPMLFTPLGILMVFGLFSLAVPMIEEGVKVLALWLFADQIKHPVQGFVLGALCGAAFALAENVGFSSTGANEWTQSVMERATAILPHTLNSGILGWAVVSAWRERAYFKLGGAYFAVILIHGMWNGISIALALSEFTAYARPPFSSIFNNATAFTVGEIFMMIGTFIGLIFVNRALRRSQPAQAEYNERPSPNSETNGDLPA